MFKYYLAVFAVIIININLLSQSSLDSVIYHYSTLYNLGTEHLFVKGRFTGNYPSELNDFYKYFNQKSIKYEDELDSADLKKHLQFYGPIGSYKYLDKFLPEVIKITDKGFSFGPYNFTDSLDVISLITSEGNRWFKLGNSMTSLTSLWTTFPDLSQYFIMQNWAITHHGFLNNNSFDSGSHYDLLKLRKKQLREFETKYYKFYYDPGLFSRKQNRDSLFSSEDSKYEKVVHFFGLNYPVRKIECFLYKDMKQKYYLSATPGLGNTFSRAFQNHSIGFGAVEHESIHILFDHQYAFVPVFLGEGLVGYYYSSFDSLEWKKTKAIVSNVTDFDVKPYLNNEKGFEFTEVDYAAGAYFTKYMIDTYGLEKFKSLFNNLSVDYSTYREIYGMSLTQICDKWKEYFIKTKIPLGTIRKIKIRVIAENIPDSSKIYITGSSDILSKWDPAGVELVKQPKGYWEKDLLFPEGSILSYKITRGLWDNEALDKEGNVPPNSAYEVKGDDIIELRIDKWKDQISY